MAVVSENVVVLALVEESLRASHAVVPRCDPVVALAVALAVAALPSPPLRDLGGIQPPVPAHGAEPEGAAMDESRPEKVRHEPARVTDPEVTDGREQPRDERYRAPHDAAREEALALADLHVDDDDGSVRLRVRAVHPDARVVRTEDENVGTARARGRRLKRAASRSRSRSLLVVSRLLNFIINE
eukprot:5819-Pelagococcus_subviridis.AAC.2